MKPPVDCVSARLQVIVFYQLRSVRLSAALLRESLHFPVQLAQPVTMQDTNDNSVYELVNLNDEVRVEQGIFVHAILRVAARIAHNSRSVQHIVEAVMRMAMYPQARAPSVDQMFGVGNEARVQERESAKRGCILFRDGA